MTSPAERVSGDAVQAYVLSRSLGPGVSAQPNASDDGKVAETMPD
jgi:hypothetical protein